MEKGVRNAREAVLSAGCLLEIFEVDEDIRDLIMQRKPASFIRSTEIMKGMKAMFQDGLAKAFMGETTIEEVFRVAL